MFIIKIIKSEINGPVIKAIGIMTIKQDIMFSNNFFLSIMPTLN